VNSGNLSFITVIICAAGHSFRMGGIKKEYQMIDESQQLTVLGSVVRTFAAVSSIKEIIIAIPENDKEKAHRAVPQVYLDSTEPKLHFINGGQTRQASVFNALSYIQNNPHYVLIHDGARPWISTGLTEQIISAVKSHNAAIPLLPLTDTPKECDAPLDNSTAFIKRHLKRANTGIAQTPQGFKFPEILFAHKKAALENEEFTDDAEIWGRFCGQVAVIPGDPANRKITFREDL